MDRIQAELEGQKNTYDAETALWKAGGSRTVASEALQLEQAGIETVLLKSDNPDLDIVMADVPHGAQSRVREGQGCEARFFGLSDEVFTGKVNNIAQVISKERRSLRVLFIIHDPQDHLRPGMFAEIGLGTDAREALLIPAESVVHIDRNDYALVATGVPGEWRVVAVRIGELHGKDAEVLDGLKAGDQVLGKGAILLKPVIVRSLQPAATGSDQKAGQ